MEPTEENLRAWARAHRPVERAEAKLPAQVRASLAGVRGRRVLHLGCGSGAATLELVELGATVTAVEPAADALAAARARGPSVAWIAAELDALPAELQRGRFDLAYAGPTTAQSVADLDRFASAVVAALRPGADLLLFDDHPAGLCVDALMHWRHDYFRGGFRRLGQTVGALARAGLDVRALEEYPGDGRSAHDTRVPRAFLLHARKPR